MKWSLLVLLIVLTSGCLSGETTYEPEQELADLDESIHSNSSVETEGASADGRPVLRGLGVDIDHWNMETDMAGDFIFDEGVLFEDQNIKNEKVLLEFGVREHAKINPEQNVEYWFFLKPGTKVRAAAEGVVSISFIEHTEDWAVHVRQPNSQWTVSFEHLQNLQVAEGDTVKPGDILGEVVLWSANNEIGFTEMAVWRGGNQIYKYCPFDFLDEGLKPIYEQKINQLTSDWEEFIGKDVYNQDSWVSPGCVVESIKES